jgi:hypothetical protein
VRQTTGGICFDPSGVGQARSRGARLHRFEYQRDGFVGCKGGLLQRLADFARRATGLWRHVCAQNRSNASVVGNTTAEYEARAPHTRFIDAYDGQVFWSQLAERLAARDLDAETAPDPSRPADEEARLTRR